MQLVLPCLLLAASAPASAGEAFDPSALMANMKPDDKRVPNTGVLAADTAEVVRRNTEEVHACYLSRMRHDPSLHGTLVVRANVFQGAVRGVETVTDTVNDAHFTRCATVGISLWVFPTALTDTVELSFELRPSLAATPPAATSAPASEVVRPGPSAIESSMSDIGARVGGCLQGVPATAESNVVVVTFAAHDGRARDVTVAGLSAEHPAVACVHDSSAAWRLPTEESGRLIMDFDLGG